MSEEIAKALGGHMYSLEELAAQRLELINRVKALESALEKAVEALDEIVNPGECSVPPKMTHFQYHIKVADEALSEIRRVNRED